MRSKTRVRLHDAKLHLIIWNLKRSEKKLFLFAIRYYPTDLLHVQLLLHLSKSTLLELLHGRLLLAGHLASLTESISVRAFSVLRTAGGSEMGGPDDCELLPRRGSSRSLETPISARVLQLRFMREDFLPLAWALVLSGCAMVC